MAKVTIDKSEYKRLLKAELKINMLEVAGVDNWTFYGEALYPDEYSFYDDDYDVACEKIDKKVDKMKEA